MGAWEKQPLFQAMLRLTESVALGRVTGWPKLTSVWLLGEMGMKRGPTEEINGRNLPWCLHQADPATSSCLCPRVFKNLIMKTGRLGGTSRACLPRGGMGGMGGEKLALGRWRGGNVEGGLEEGGGRET